MLAIIHMIWRKTQGFCYVSTLRA